MKRFLLLSTLVAACGINAMAAINLGAPVISGTGPFTWTYTATLSGDSRLDDTEGGGLPVSYFTIYDLGGIVSNIFAPVGWSYTVQNTGITPPTQLITETSTVNITYKYVGTVDGSPESISSTLALNTALGQFGFDTTSTTARVDTYTFQGYNTTTNQVQGGNDSTLVPGETRGGEVPEPATMGLMGATLAGVALLIRRRK